MRKVDDGEERKRKKKKKEKEKRKKKKEKKRMTFLVATTSLPAVDRPNADRWNAARSCQKMKKGSHLTINVIDLISTAHSCM